MIKKLINKIISFFKEKVNLEVISDEDFSFKPYSIHILRKVKNTENRNYLMTIYSDILKISKKYNINPLILICTIDAVKNVFATSIVISTEEWNNGLTKLMFPCMVYELDYIAKMYVRNFRRFEPKCPVTLRDIPEKIYPKNASTFALYMQIPFAGIDNFYNVNIERDDNNVLIDKKLVLIHKKPHGISKFFRCWKEIKGENNESTISGVC